jgi:hypothetical protein
MVAVCTVFVHCRHVHGFVHEASVCEEGMLWLCLQSNIFVYLMYTTFHHIYRMDLVRRNPTWGGNTLCRSDSGRCPGSALMQFDSVDPPCSLQRHFRAGHKLLPGLALLSRVNDDLRQSRRATWCTSRQTSNI